MNSSTNCFAAEMSFNCCQLLGKYVDDNSIISLLRKFLVWFPVVRGSLDCFN